MAAQGNIIFFIQLKLSEIISDLLQYKHILDREAPDVDRFKKAFLKNQNFAPRNHLKAKKPAKRLPFSYRKRNGSSILLTILSLFMFRSDNNLYVGYKDQPGVYESDCRVLQEFETYHRFVSRQKRQDQDCSSKEAGECAKVPQKVCCRHSLP